MKYIIYEKLNRIFPKPAPPNKVGLKVDARGKVKKVKSAKDLGIGEVMQSERGYTYKDPKGRVWYYYIRAWYDSKNRKLKGPYWYKKRRLSMGESYSSGKGRTKGPGDVVDVYVGKKLPFSIPRALSTNPATLPRSVLNLLSKSTRIADKLKELSG